MALLMFSTTAAPVWIIMAFVSFMLIPLMYYLCIPLWLMKNWKERFQFWAGCLVYTFGGPFINITVTLYASWYMDSFGWGKTRKVITEDENSTTSDEKDKTKDASVQESEKDVPRNAPIENPGDPATLDLERQDTRRSKSSLSKKEPSSAPSAGTPMPENQDRTVALIVSELTAGLERLRSEATSSRR